MAQDRIQGDVRKEAPAGQDILKVVDQRTGASYEVPIVDGTIRASALREMRTSEDDFGLLSYDPAFVNTASCRSRITYIDGDRGILEYRGYPIDQLAERARFVDVAYLLLCGELPDETQGAEWSRSIAERRFVHSSVRAIFDGFVPTAHPMAMLISGLAALSTVTPEANDFAEPGARRDHIASLLAKVATLAAWAHRRTAGLPYTEPDPSLSHAASFLHLVFQRGAKAEAPHPVLERAMDVLFTLHADHEQNCSTNAMRGVASSHADPYCSMAAATAALYGPLHGGANEAVLRMLRSIGTRDQIPAFVERVKAGETRLMGFGHRVYKNYDPRAKIIKQLAYEVFEVAGRNPLLEIALELERIALEDDYFVDRRLYPNVDFYSGLIYQSMGFPVGMFPVLFAVGRAAGWLAQWNELVEDPEQRIARPRQVYIGPARRDLPAARNPSVRD